MSRLLRLIPAFLFIAKFSHAQDSAFVHVNAGVIYNSGLNYYGRVDSLESKGVCPFIGLSLKNGLYVNSTFVFVENSLQSQYAATLLEAGYNFGGSISAGDSSGAGNAGTSTSAGNFGKHWAGNLSVSRFLYRPEVDLVESVVREMASASLTRLNKVANITLTASARWSSQVDYNAQAGLDHIIRIPNVLSKKGVLVFDPTATISAGTQNFTTTYYQEKNFLFLPVQEQQITATSEQFNILAYELSCPIVYGLGKARLMLSPAYVVPQHLITGAELGSNLFYITALVKITL
ncbi:MAG TPA: hypothetical protein VG605_10185 [Puia sp.]|nr:hypothetical protein [Puia sp.]